MGLIEIIGERRLYLDSNIFIYMLEEPSAYEASVGELAAKIDDGVIEALTSELSLAETLVKPIREAPEYVSVYQRLRETPSARFLSLVLREQASR